MKKLFLLDAAGALLSAFLLGVVLVRLESFFGIPRSTLYFLAALPVVFAMYDFYCYYKVEGSLEKYLKGIAVVNLFYCGISLLLALYHIEYITIYGWVYIIVEIIIVMALALYELKVANAQTKNTKYE